MALSRPIPNAVRIINRAFSRAVVDFFSVGELYVNSARSEKVRRLNNKVM